MGQASEDPGGLRYWTQTIDGTLYRCWYRLRPDGKIEVFARGQRVVLPLEAIALLPEPIARAVLRTINSRDHTDESNIAAPLILDVLAREDTESGKASADPPASPTTSPRVDPSR